jgi:hypothetical protein
VAGGAHRALIWRFDASCMRTYIRFLGSGALTLVGILGTIVLQGGWEAAAAGFATILGTVCAVNVALLVAAAERPQRSRPDWALAGAEPRGVPASAPADATRARAREERPERAPRSPRRHPSAVGGRSA